jgi:CheY-like chemotaxis protein
MPVMDGFEATDGGLLALPGRHLQELPGRRAAILQAVDGRSLEALRMAAHALKSPRKEHSPDLILLDLHLPDMAGDETLRHLRKDPATKRIPVVIISADATPSQIRRLRAAGANEYLTKPLDVKRFLEVVDAMLARDLQDSAARGSAALPSA